jgi:hypothetical protein
MVASHFEKQNPVYFDTSGTEMQEYDNAVHENPLVLLPTIKTAPWAPKKLPSARHFGT